MKRINKKGFTLIELLAAIVILGIIMGVAIPNVIGILNNSRNETYVNDAKKLISLAEYKFRSDSSIIRPEKDNCTVLTMEYLDNSEFEDSPNKKGYDKLNSVVIIKNEKVSETDDNEYVYDVNLIEDPNRTSPVGKGISLKKYDDLNNEKPNDLVTNSAGDVTSSTQQNPTVKSQTNIGPIQYDAAKTRYAYYSKDDR